MFEVGCFGENARHGMFHRLAPLGTLAVGDVDDGSDLARDLALVAHVRCSMAQNVVPRAFRVAYLELELAACVIRRRRGNRNEIRVAREEFIGSLTQDTRPIEAEQPFPCLVDAPVVALRIGEEHRIGQRLDHALGCTSGVQRSPANSGERGAGFGVLARRVAGAVSARSSLMTMLRRISC